MNGLTTLSDGDVATYQRIVNHGNHNTPFFYALLVVAKQATAHLLQRYSIKHFLFCRGDPRVYQIAPQRVQLCDSPLVWPVTTPGSSRVEARAGLQERLGANPERAVDRDFLSQHFPAFRPFSSPKVGFYWRGTLDLIAGCRIEILVVEDLSQAALCYTVLVREPPSVLLGVIEELGRARFRSAREALVATERSCLRALVQSSPKGDSAA